MKPLMGRVYVLSNYAMPGLIKIGFTMGAVEDRVRELSSTGVPVHFKIEYQAECRDAERVEQHVHKAFRAHRVPSGREFFRITREEARLKIRELGDVIDEETNFPVTVEQLRAEREKVAAMQREQAERAVQRVARDVEMKRINAEIKAAQEYERQKIERRNLEASKCRCLPEWEFRHPNHDGVWRLLGAPFGMRKFVDVSLLRVAGNELSWWEITTYKRATDYLPSNVRCTKTNMTVTYHSDTGSFRWSIWTGYYSDQAGTVLVSEKAEDSKYSIRPFVPENWTGFVKCLVHLPSVQIFMNRGKVISGKA